MMKHQSLTADRRCAVAGPDSFVPHDRWPIGRPFLQQTSFAGRSVRARPEELRPVFASLIPGVTIARQETSAQRDYAQERGNSSSFSSSSSVVNGYTLHRQEEEENEIRERGTRHT